ncbi:hypothetical protein HK098_004650 [Nowakowskiella sp. JEL0407]|nr:hypothetical protein HK098_004650 [Nowakowskiella sp. JEL0407]
MKRLNARKQKPRPENPNENAVKLTINSVKKSSKRKQKIRVGSSILTTPTNISDPLNPDPKPQSENNSTISSDIFENDVGFDTVLNVLQVVGTNDGILEFGSAITSSSLEDDFFDFSNEEFSSSTVADDFSFDSIGDVELSIRDKEAIGNGNVIDQEECNFEVGVELKGGLEGGGDGEKNRLVHFSEFGVSGTVAMGDSWTQKSSTFYPGWPVAAIPIYYNSFSQYSPSSTPVPQLLHTSSASDILTEPEDEITSTTVTDPPRDVNHPADLEETNIITPDGIPIPFKEWEPIRPKIPRRKTSGGQLRILNKVFERWPTPSTKLRVIIGEEVEMCPRTVQVWFQNKRQNQKKQIERKNAKVLTARDANVDKEMHVKSGKHEYSRANGDEIDEAMAEKMVREWASMYYTKTGIIHERPEKVDKRQRTLKKSADPKNPVWVFETPYYQAKI